MLLAIARDAAPPRDRRLQVDRHRPRARHDHRRPARHGADDRGAAANRVEPRFRRLVRHAGRHGGVLSAIADVPPFMMAVLSLEVILGSLTFTGSLMAAGKLQEVLPQRPITYKGQNLVNLRLLGCAVVAGRLPGRLIPAQTWLFPVIVVDSAGLRRADDHPDRRRRHADGDLPAQFLRRALGRRHGVRARQQAADHRRGARRRLGLHPLGEHVEGDEPLVHQRPVRGVRPGAGRRGGGAGGASRSGARRPRRRRRSSPRRTRWSSSRATAWRSRRPSTRCASSTTR